MIIVINHLKNKTLVIKLFFFFMYTIKTKIDGLHQIYNYPPKILTIFNT